ncbi:MAG: alpha/beta hydrolase [Ilumatobacteraceae bacterium]|nr:alpha/beta hydrolase [Ilumatobacteraceae bacterium]
MADTKMKIECVSANGTDFSYLECGTGKLALLLHGFPDTAQTWRHLMPELADMGYRVVAPFMRGYAPSAVPSDGCYQTAMLARDANALHENLGGDSESVIIGHDWGAPSCYGAAIDAPTRWCKVVGMAVPPTAALGMAFVQNLEQIKKSWYMFFFQHGLADLVVGANNHAFIEMLWRDWSPGYDASFDLESIRKSLADPKNLQAALGYYRATLGDGYRDPQLSELQNQMASGVPTQPLLYLHGANDGCIGVDVVESAKKIAPANVKFEVVAAAGHFLQLEQPKVVNKLICDFLAN